jgi:hypothetical protein
VNTIPYFQQPMVIGGQTFSLSHLNSLRLIVPSEVAKRELSVHVRFTTHCFTKSYDAEMHPAGDPILMDEGGRPRTFCPVRFPLSLGLPEIIRGLNHPKMKVYQTGSRRNWLHSAMVEGPGGPYHIFFEVRRAPAERRRQQDIELVVESAYPQGEIKQPPATVGSMGFVLLVGKVFLGQPVATRR